MKKADETKPIDPPPEESTTVETASTAINPDGEKLTTLQAENEQLRTTIRNAEAHRQITAELKQAGSRSPELLFAAIKSGLKFTADGAVENMSGLIDKLKGQYPEQFGADASGSIDAGAGKSAGLRLTRTALSKMTPAEIAALSWDEVRSVLAAG